MRTFFASGMMLALSIGATAARALDGQPVPPIPGIRGNDYCMGTLKWAGGLALFNADDEHDQPCNIRSGADEAKVRKVCSVGSECIVFGPVNLSCKNIAEGCPEISHVIAVKRIEDATKQADSADSAPPSNSKLATPSKDCLTDGRILTMRGTVVEKFFTDYDQGRPFKHRYLALEFYRPRCSIAEYSESEPSAMFEQIDETSQYWIGRHVIAKVKVSETGGTIHYPTSVVLTPIDIQEESQ